MIAAKAPFVRPIWSGYITRSGDKVIDASSSVTLIEVGEKRIMVDTGSPKDEDRLIKVLARMKVELESIRFVINTHMHIDHSEGSISVFVSAGERFAICGDAIPTRANYDNWVPPFLNFSPELALRSMELIRSWADVIIPGHDVPISVDRKR
jgi:glyoxylase-like metal-dependent hydrolase (beta-lactamase superfamily II)